MPTSDQEIAEALLSVYRWVPPAGPGICVVCHGQRQRGLATCESCYVTRNQVSRPLESVVPISLYRVGEQLHTILRGYKDSQSAVLRERFSQQVAAMVSYFLRRHRACIGGWDVITTVPPSTVRSTETFPLESALSRVRWLEESASRLLARTATPAGHRRASDEGYSVTGEVEGKVVLLLDDTFTTGASLQSAASALSLAGTADVRAVVVGRVINTDRSPEVWRKSGRMEFSFDRCCVERDG